MRQLFLLVAVASGCTNVNLCSIDPATGECLAPLPPVEDNVIAVEGTACTVDPGWVIFPYKVLFVIDLSRSNTESDPNDYRAEAVKQAVDQYIENRAVSFGVVGFSDSAERVTQGFTRDYDVLVPHVIDSIKREIAGTNYLDTVDLVREFLEEDIANTPEAERHRTRYNIQWLSDGIPDPCQQPAAIFDALHKVMELRAEYGLYDLTLDASRLYHPGYSVPGCEMYTPLDYLPEMAEIGHGDFREFQDARDIEFTIEFTEIHAPFERHTSFPLFVVNENRVVWDNRLWPDSDGDGLRDADEEGEPDPLAFDHNFDGCFDRVDDALRPNPPSVCSELCRARIENDEFGDLDRDGIPDCTEQTLGYHMLRSDTDLDGFTDLLELKHGTSPISNNIAMDTDYDGCSDGDELAAGTDPRDPDENDELRYHYSGLEPASPETDLGIEGVTCVDFRVDNVRLVHTVETVSAADADVPGVLLEVAPPAHREGDNLICVYLVQTSVYDPETEPTVTRACKTARYLPDADFKDPANGVLRIEPGDFRCFTNCEEI